MALDPLSEWGKALDNLPRTGDIAAGCLNFATAIAGLTDKVQAGDDGQAGILTFNKAIFAVQLQALAPTGTDSWTTIVATSWLAAMTASVITPGTVSKPVWAASEGKDTETLATAAGTISNLSAASAFLETALKATKPALTSQAVAKAFRDATLMLQFTVIGKAPGTPPSPVPLTETAK